MLYGGEKIPKHIPDKDIPCIKVELPKSGRPRQKQKNFIKGPIDLSWMSAACQVSGKAVSLALALWYLAGLNKSREDLKLTQKILDLFNVSQRTKYSVLEALEKAGLVTVSRSLGKKHRISIVLSAGRKDG